MKLGITLKILAGSIYLDIMVRFQVGALTPYAVYNETCAALGKVLKLSAIPRTIDELHDQFSASNTLEKGIVQFMAVLVLFTAL